MQVLLQNTGRRFNRDWIFKELSYAFNPGESYAVLGPNGSGKSTLLQVISGSLSPSAGSIVYRDGPKTIDTESVYQYLSMTAPYLELIEEFSLLEQICFHFRFKSYKEGMDQQAVIDLLGLKTSQDKAIKYFSSGMKQRTRLALAFCSHTPLLLLDEPCTNLDEEGINWYHRLVADFAGDRLLIVASNQQHEYQFCSRHLLITDFK